MIFIYCIHYSRTPGSRQPSPGEEEFQKNAAATLAVSAGSGGVVLLKPGVDVVGSEEHFMAAFAPAPPHHLQHHQAPPTHHLQHPHSHAAAQLFGAQAPPPPQGPPPSQQQQQQGPPQPQDTTTHFDVQVSHICLFLFLISLNREKLKYIFTFFFNKIALLIKYRRKIKNKNVTFRN